LENDVGVEKKILHFYIYGVSSVSEKVERRSDASIEGHFYQEKDGDEKERLYSRGSWDNEGEKIEENKDWNRDDGSGFETYSRSDCTYDCLLPCSGRGEKKKKKKMDWKTKPKKVSKEEGIPPVLGKDS
jgi:hypothetical protein